MRQQESYTSETRSFRTTFVRRTPLRGFSMLEFVVAMTIFGIAIAGLFPLLQAYMIQVQRLEKCSVQCGQCRQNANKTWTLLDTHNSFIASKLPSDPDNQRAYPSQWNLVPVDDPWLWKLGAQASLIPDNPALLPGTHAPYLRPFPYTAPTTAALVADDSITNSADATHGYYTETGIATWSDGPVTGSMDTSRRAVSATECQAATWKFKNVQPGWYEVWVTWPDPAATPKPAAPNDIPRKSSYALFDGANSAISGGSTPEIDQSKAASGKDFDGVTTVTWQCIIESVYIPKRNDPGNQATKTDSNGRSVTVYDGDTIALKIRHPGGDGFITADGARLVALGPNMITRSTPLKWTWTADDNRTVTAKVSVSR